MCAANDTIHNKTVLQQCGIIACALLLAPRVQAQDKVACIENSVPVKQVQLGKGFVADRVEKNKDHYLKTFPIGHYVQLMETKNYTEWDWRKGEQPGKWLESSILTLMRTGDRDLGREVQTMYNRILQSQDSDGYMGITSKVIRTPEKPLRGMDAYELYFLQHALLTAYEQWQDKRALQAAKKLGDYFIRYIGPGKAGFWPSKERYPANVHKVYKGTVHSDLAGHSIHYSWEGTLLIDPMMRLYQLTNEPRYLDWSKWVVSNIDTWSGWNAYSNLDKVADGTMHINEIQPYVHAHTFQMNFLGLLRLYQATGDTAYLRKVKGAWDDVAKRQMYITGGVSVGEHYERDYIKPLTGKMVETCATMSWMQLSQYLLSLTGDTRYADAMEKLLWNHVLAAQSCDGDGYRYNTPPNGYKPEGIYREPDCCSGSGHRLFSMLPQFIYATGRQAVYVNQFVSSSATLQLEQAGKVQLTQVTGYPQTEQVVIDVKPARTAQFTLYVRIPGWCKNARLAVNGTPVNNTTPGTYAALQRTWKKGDRVTLSLPMQLQWVRHEHYMKTSDRKPYPAEPDADAPYALQRGPLVYAVDNIRYKGSLADFPNNWMEQTSYLLANPASLPAVQPGKDMLGPGYQVPVLLANGNKTTLPVFPFANIGQWYKNGEPKPDSSAAVYGYAIWLKGKKE